MRFVSVPDARKIRETEKALLVEIEGEEHWVPKSFARLDPDGSLEIPKWLAEEKTIEYDDEFEG